MPSSLPGRQPTTTVSIVRTRLTFTIPLRSPGPVGRVELLGDHALGALQPRLGLGAVRRPGREVERLAHQLLQPLAARVEGLVEQRLAVVRPAGRRRRTAPASPPRACGSATRRGGCAAGAPRTPACRPRRRSPARRRARSRRAGTRAPGSSGSSGLPLRDWRKRLVAVHEGDRPEAVPLGLVGPLLALGQGGARQRELRHHRGRERGHRRIVVSASGSPLFRTLSRGNTTLCGPSAPARTRLPAAVPQRGQPAPPADRRRGGRAGPADRARRLRRQGADGQLEPAPRGLDREALPRPGRPAHGPDPGGHPGPDPRGREVRLAPRAEVLDLRDSLDPPVDRARHRLQGPHDPDPGARPPARAQDPPHRPGADRTLRARADRRGDRRRGRAARAPGARGARGRARGDEPRPPRGRGRRHVAGRAVRERRTRSRSRR